MCLGVLLCRCEARAVKGVLDLPSRVLRAALLQLLERIMRGSDEFPPVLARVVERDTPVGKAASVQLAIRGTVVVSALEHVVSQCVLVLHFLSRAC